MSSMESINYIFCLQRTMKAAFDTNKKSNFPYSAKVMFALTDTIYCSTRWRGSSDSLEWPHLVQVSVQ
jgi:hypothetical protein